MRITDHLQGDLVGIIGAWPRHPLPAPRGALHAVPSPGHQRHRGRWHHLVLHSVGGPRQGAPRLVMYSKVQNYFYEEKLVIRCLHSATFLLLMMSLL